MKSILSHALAAAAVIYYAPCSSFTAPSRTAARPAATLRLNYDMYSGDIEARFESPRELDRRSVLSNLSSLLPASFLLASSSAPLPAVAGDKGKVVVWGGSGWVGAHVARDLSASGYDVVSISRSSPDAQIARTESILGKALPGVAYVSLDAGTAGGEELAGAMKDVVAVISCVGISPGSPNQKDGNGVVNTRIAEAAKAAGAPRFVYVGVASSLANGPAKFLLGDYFKGKSEAEKSVAKAFGDDALIVKPAIVAGGTPGEIRPPGPPGVKPVGVEALAKVLVAGATGAMTGSVDGNDAIEAAAL